MFISSLNELFKAKIVCIFFTECNFDAEKFASFFERTFDAENLCISFPKILINRYQYKVHIQDHLIDFPY